MSALPGGVARRGPPIALVQQGLQRGLQYL
jgi:hypothetical protein